MTKATQNILLEYGDCDLDDLFYFQLPPVLQTEIEEFWNHLFEVADAVEKIHNLTIVNDKIATHYYGYACDFPPLSAVLTRTGGMRISNRRIYWK